MYIPRFTTISLWILTTFVLVSTALKYEPQQRQPLAPFSASQELNVDKESISRLLQATPLSSSTPKNLLPTAENFSLKGIVYATTAEQSRALIQSPGGKIESFAPGRQLPNGARLIRIERRSITYELQGALQQRHLPTPP